jgi:hypothetical protein
LSARRNVNAGAGGAEGGISEEACYPEAPRRAAGAGGGLGAITLRDDIIYSPEPEAVGPLATAFARMMFAHARFEGEVRLLQDAIVNERGFAEDPDNQLRNARKRPKKMAKLIKKKLGDIAETPDIVRWLKLAIEPCDRRNDLAHGEWVKFDQSTNTVTVRTGARRKADSMYRKFDEGAIARLAVAFNGIRTELSKLRRAVQKHVRPFPESVET